MQSMKVLVLLLFSICFPDLYHSQGPFAGPYYILVHQIDQCEESGTRQIYVSSTRINKVSRTKYLYSTNITTEFEANDEITIELDIAILGNGGWRPHFAQFEFPQFCTFMKQLIPNLYSAINKAIHAECPVPAGTYEMKDFELGNFKIPSQPKLPYGKYRVDIQAKINGILIGCFRYYCDVVPARREQPRYKKKNNS